MLWIFINSNFFVGLMTIVVGVSAIYIYLKQKRDKRREAARLILQEIRYAEQQIRIFRGADRYELYIRLLPTNSWNENIHLFVKDLEEHEIDMISSFYARAKYIDYLIEKRSQQIIEHTPFSLPQNQGTPIPPQQNIQELVTVSLLQQVSSKVEFIHNTPVVERLRLVATKKWYQLT